MSVFNRYCLVLLLVIAATSGTATFAGNFISETQAASEFGGHQIVLTGNDSVAPSRGWPSLTGDHVNGGDWRGLVYPWTGTDIVVSWL